MRPILFQFGDCYIVSYSAMMFLGVFAGVIAVLLRIRGKPVDGPLLAKAMIAAVVSGWLFGRAGLWLDGTARDAGIRVLSPAYQAPGSLTYFLIGVCAGLLVFAAAVGKAAVACLDAMAPSTFTAMLFAKIGCLLGGCCAGGTCLAPLGIAYPYGSPVYEYQYRTGALAVPPELVRPAAEANGPRLWGHAQTLALEPERFADLLAGAGLSRESAPAMIELARTQRSLPVWPVPIAASAASLALWTAAEFVYRKSKRPGTTLAFVFAAYGALRLTLDWFIALRGARFLDMSVAQWVGTCAIVLAAVIWVRRPQPAD